MIRIKLENNTYWVYLNNGSAIPYDKGENNEGYYKALDLCRLRLGTTLKENKIKVIKVPFIGLWLVW